MEATIHEEEEEQQVSKMSSFKDLSQLNIHNEMIEKYRENKEHFYLNKMIEENQGSIYQWIYKYESNEITLEYSLLNQFWKFISINSDSLIDQDQLIQILNNINHKKYPISFEQQVQLIRFEFDQYCSQLNRINLPILKPIIQTDQYFSPLDQNKSFRGDIEVFVQEQRDNENRIDLPILKPAVQTDQHLSTSNISKHRIRQDSSCSSTNSIRYTEFVPPSTTNPRRRRVIRTIQVQVQRKKTFFGKLFDKIKSDPIEAVLYRLGLQFLCVYDGKFNHPLGHTLVLSFENQTWFLTITDIKCVQCELDQSEPRSTLILNYKNKHAHVQV